MYLLDSRSFIHAMLPCGVLLRYLLKMRIRSKKKHAKKVHLTVSSSQ